MSLKRCVLSGFAALLLACPAPAQPVGGTWSNLRDSGHKALKSNNLVDAGKFYQQALTEAERFGQNDPRLAESLDNLAQVRQEEKRYADAEALLKRAFALRKKTLASGDPLLSLNLANLMTVYSLAGREDDAVNLYNSEKSVSQYVEPVTCEYCGSRDKLQSVYYGQPTPRTKDLARRGKIKVMPAAPGSKVQVRAQWFCTACDAMLNGNGKGMAGGGHVGHAGGK